MTLGLVLLAAATLVLGFVSSTAWLIYASIGCSAVAAAMLLRSSRRRRESAEVEDNMAWTASLAEPDSPPTASASTPRPQSDPRVDADTVVHPRVEPAVASSLPARRRPSGATRTMPSPVTARFEEPESEIDEPEPVLASVAASPTSRDWSHGLTPTEPVPGSDGLPTAAISSPRARTPKRTSFASDWVQGAPPPPPPPPAAAPVAPVRLAAPAAVAPRPPAPVAPRPSAVGPRPAAPAPVGPRPSAVGPRPAAPSRQAAAPPSVASPARRRAPAPAAEDYPFPIEEYEYLLPADILPLLPELDDQELVEVLVFEQAGANRAVIINQIDALLEGEEG